MAVAEAEARPTRPARTLSEDVFGATLWNTLLLPARIVVSLLTSVVYYGVLSRSQIGVLFLLQNLANSLGVYADLGIERTLPRFLPEVEHAQGRSGVRRLLRRVLDVKLLVVAPVVVGLLVFAGPLAKRLAARQRGEAQAALQSADPGLQERARTDLALADLLESRSLLLLLAVAVLVVCGALHDVFMQTLASFFKRREWNLITLVGSLMQPLLVAAMVLLGLGVPGVLAGLVLTPLVGLFLSGRAARHTTQGLKEVAPPHPLAPLLPRFARFSGFTWLIQLTTWLYDLPFLVLFAARTLSLGEVALLGFAYKFAKDFVIYVFWPLVGLVQPVLARIKARESEAAMADAYRSLVRIVWLVVLPAGVGLSLVTPPLLAALYPKYAEGAGLAVLFVAFVFADALLHVATLVMMTAERYRAVLLSRLLGLLSVPAILWLMPRYGMLGAALAVGVVRLLPALVTTGYVSLRMGLALPLRFGLRLVVACVAFAVPLAILLRAGTSKGFDPALGPRLLSLLPLFGVALLGAALFLVALKATGGLEADDRRRLLELNLPAKKWLARIV